jgi:hypothetical protein
MVREMEMFEAEEVSGGDWISDAGKALGGVAKAVVNTAASIIKAVGEAASSIIGGRERTYYPNGQVQTSKCSGIVCLTNK